MDETELEVHERTYHHFTLAVKWFAIHFLAIALFLGLWFATPAGFWWGLIAAIVVVAIAVWSMRHGLAHSSEGHHVEGLHPPPAHG